MKPLRQRLLWVTTILMLGMAVLGIAGELGTKFHSLPREGKPQGWLRGTVGLHRVWLSWHLSKPAKPTWAGQVNYFGFRYTVYSDGDGYVAMTAWYLIPPAILIAGCCIIAARKFAAPRHGYCPKCGYDLRASPQRCPECGCEVFAPLSEFAD